MKRLLSKTNNCSAMKTKTETSLFKAIQHIIMASRTLISSMKPGSLTGLMTLELRHSLTSMARTRYQQERGLSKTKALLCSEIKNIRLDNQILNRPKPLQFQTFMSQSCKLKASSNRVLKTLRICSKIQPKQS